MSLSLGLPPRAALVAGALLLAVAGLGAQATPAAGAPAGCRIGNAHAGSRVLVFSRTAAFRHGSIPYGIAAVQRLGAGHRFAVETTENPALFTDSILRRFGAVVFMSTTGDVLNDAQQAAFERFIRRGGGFVGVHSASDTEYDWPWYGRLVGAYFKRHPAVQQATVRVVNQGHLATRCLGRTWMRVDEWYDFRAAPAKTARILMTLDETTYRGGGMGTFHPLSWYHRFDGGRAFYTELGHTDESYSDPAYLNHLGGGILWALAR